MSRYRVETKMSGQWERVGRFMLCASAIDEETLWRSIEDAEMLASPDYNAGPTRVCVDDGPIGKAMVVWSSEEAQHFTEHLRDAHKYTRMEAETELEHRKREAPDG